MGAAADYAEGRIERKAITVARKVIEHRAKQPRPRSPWVYGGYLPREPQRSPLEEAAHMAYAGVVEDRRWERGHGGYSGTFAEKGQVDVVLLSKNLTPRQWRAFTDFIEDYHADGVPSGPALTVAKKLGLTVERTVEMHRTFDDKWGPTLMLVTPDRRWWAGGYCSS